MCNFSTDDVLALAKAVIDDPVQYQDGDQSSYYWCEYCEAELQDRRYEFTEKDFKHDLNCPVLIAHDILTGF